MDKETLNIVAHSPGSPVVLANSTEPMATEQRWGCQVCGQQMGYSLPISLSLAGVLISAFMAAHTHKCGHTH